nr:lipopolysaccharide biosynthesis protein [Pseudarthrobacter sp. ATCC 49987]
MAAQRGLPFLALPIVSRATTQFEYGAASLAISVGSVLSVIMTLGINAAMPRLYAQPRLNSDRAAWVSLVVVQISFAVVLLAATGCGTLIIGPRIFGPQFNALVTPTLFLAVISSIQMTYQGLAIARGASSRLLAATLLQLVLGLTLAQVLSEAFGGAGYIYALVISSTAATAMLIAFRHPKPDWDVFGVRSGLRLAVPFIGQGLSTWLLALFDRIVIGVILGATQVGGYQVAYMAGSMIGMILEGLQAAWAPRFHRSRNKEKKEVLVKLLSPSLWLTSCMVLLLVSVAPIILPLAAPSYAIDYVLVSLVALSALPRAIYFVAIAGLLNEGRSTAVMMSTMVSAAFTVVTALLLIPSLGIIGGGIVTLAAFMIQSLIVSQRAFAWSLRRTAGLVFFPALATSIVAGIVVLISTLGFRGSILTTIFLVFPVAFASLKALRVFTVVLNSWQEELAPRVLS